MGDYLIVSQQAQLLFRVKRQSLKGFLAGVFVQKRLEIFGGYKLFVSGGNFLLRQGELGGVFLDRLFYLGWSIIFYLLVLSNLVTGFSTFYRSPEVAFLMTLPVDNKQIFRIKFIENLVYSSWAILILGIPLTLGYGALQGLTVWQYGLVFITGILPFLFIATVSASLLLMLLVFLSRFFKMRTVFIFLGVVFTGIFYLYFSVSQQDTMLSGNMGNFRALGRYLANLSNTSFPFIPSFWLSRLFMGSETLVLIERLFYSALFVTTAAVGWEVINWAAERFYFHTYQVMEGQGQKTKRTPLSKVFKFSWGGMRPPLKALASKDLVQFLRTPQQWVQFLLLGFFIAVYLINLSRGHLHFDELSSFWRTTIYIFNFGFTGFILAALTARFVYPMISMEGRSLWLLQMAPFSMKRVFVEKFWFAFFVLFTMTEIVALISNFFLGQRLEVSLLASGFLLLTSLSLISLSLGLGAVYAQFNETNPMKISSGYGGIITVVLSLIYVAFSVTSLVLVINLYQNHGSGVVIGIIVGFVLVLTALYTWLPLKWGIRAISSYER
jgi:ABC-2 type transport system permease protein